MKRLALALIASLTLSIGCGGSDPPVVTSNTRLTTANFDAIHDGMTTADVHRILGRPTEPQANKTVKVKGSDIPVVQYKWQRDGKEIEVNFVRDKVVSKSAQRL